MLIWTVYIIFLIIHTTCSVYFIFALYINVLLPLNVNILQNETLLFITIECQVLFKLMCICMN